MGERSTVARFGIDRYRLLDVGTKLAGLVLVSLALERGIGSTTGAVLALAGVGLGVCTVFVTEENT